MPLLGIHKNELSFDIIETLDPKTIVVLDKSVYLDIMPDKPKIEVLAPGYSKSFYVPYKPFETTVITASQLNIGCGDNLNLPDGVYCITMSICPNDVVYLSKTYLKTDLLEYELDEKLLKVLTTKNISDELKRKLTDVDFILTAAKAHARNGNIKEATNLYSRAQKILSKINCK